MPFPVRTFLGYRTHFGGRQPRQKRPTYYLCLPKLKSHPAEERCLTPSLNPFPGLLGTNVHWTICHFPCELVVLLLVSKFAFEFVVLGVKPCNLLPQGGGDVLAMFVALH